MKLKYTKYFKLLLLLAFSPALSYADPPSGSPYYADKASSYVQDQVSRDMAELNKFLCIMAGMAPDQMFNKGDYIAMVDLNPCLPKANDGKPLTGVNYIYPTVNVSRKSNRDPMISKIWVDDIPYKDANNNNQKFKVRMYVSATDAPAKFLPYGAFRMDYCKIYPDDTNNLKKCTDHIGYIEATKDGLSFYQKDNAYDTTNGNYSEDLALALSAASTTSNGKGIVIKTNNNNSNGSYTSSAVAFANNSYYFYRNSDEKLSNGNDNKQCFDRSEIKASESAWTYGLYTQDTGQRVNRTSGYNLKYTTGGQTYYGFIDKWGIYMPVDVPDGATVTREDTSTTPATIYNYTVKRTGGRLTKYTQNFDTLSSISGSSKAFQFYPYKDVYINGSTTTVGMTAYNNYLIYWDNTNSLFYVDSKMDTTTWTWTKLATPVALSNTSMQTSMDYYDSYSGTTYHYDFYGWSVATGSFTIKQKDLATLSTNLGNTMMLTTQSWDGYVFPADFSTVGSSLYCITDCPTKASIDNWINNAAAYNISPLARPSYDYSTWTQKSYTFTGNATSTGVITDGTTSTTVANMAYTLDSTTGNLKDSTGAAVVQNNATYWGVWGNGRMINGTDWATVVSKTCGGASCATATAMGDGNVDRLADLANTNKKFSYYYWQTGPTMWDQLVYLVDSSNNIVTFQDPLQLSFTVPNASKYGGYKNQTYSLWYKAFDTLPDGMPTYCVDMRSNDLGTGCTWSNPDDYLYYRYVPAFTIPTDTTSGVVTVTGPSGDPLVGKTLLVKSLEKELRLLKVGYSICDVQGLTSVTIQQTLPSETLWNDPTGKLGDKPVFNPVPAPAVIDGVVQTTK